MFTHSFTCEDPKSAKRQSSHQCLFALLETTCAKIASKTLVKSTPDLCSVAGLYFQGADLLDKVKYHVYQRFRQAELDLMV